MRKVTALAAMVTAGAALSGPGPDLTKMVDVPTTHLRNVSARGTGPLFADLKAADAASTARAAAQKAGLGKDWEVLSQYKTARTGVSHVTLRQRVGGVACGNCLLQCNVDRRGRVINMAHVAHTGAAPATEPTTSARAAVQAVVKQWGATVPGDVAVVEESGRRVVFGAHKQLSPDKVVVELSTLVTSPGVAKLVWYVYIETEQPHYHMYEAYVEAAPAKGASPEVLHMHDLVNWDEFKVQEGAVQKPKRRQAKSAGARVGGQYEVYGIPHTDPTLGDRVVRDDIDFRASPLGWHDQGNGKTFTTTWGNNVCAQDNPTGSWRRACIDTYRPDGGLELDFRFDFDEFADPKTHPTKDAAITNLFYWHNVVHDIFYLNGFDEEAGNFQENNFGKGGLGDDAVQANAQDGAGFNNANFATPRDGERPRCRMYLWNAHTPMKDGDFDSGIIIHEIGHGVSNRLTGGPAATGCLPGGQSGGMGEGWSDWWAIQLLQEERFTKGDAFPMGDYVAAGGIRNYPYSYNMEINPATFSYLSRSGYTGVHAIGSVWAGILHDVYFLMREEFGFSPNWYNGTAGNNVLWQNVVDGLKLQPCRPTFVDARDAILLADEQNYGGKHQCTMWCGFARRGLGVSATTTGYTDRNPHEAFDFPAECSCADRR
eukprot:TRINITY_DN532_c0_g1_i1.p1 TRINITY_DN532_c0_g1~~TRINITY_DN532_c0_g1_i1.p1  ORF type:complete len:656 (+),score=227.10 TRINITY_DN532_c0_g1_i1:72-2039(+)